MADKHYVLLRETPWAGPTAIQVDTEERNFASGASVRPPRAPSFALRVDQQAQDVTEFPPCDLQSAKRGQLLMSPKLIATLTNAGVTNLQYFDCQVVYEPTGESLPYRLANILGVVKAVDTAESDCTVNENGVVEAFRTLRFAEARLNGFDLFRLHEFRQMLIVSERLKRALEDADISGVRIIEDTAWQPGML